MGTNVIILGSWSNHKGQVSGDRYVWWYEYSEDGEGKEDTMGEWSVSVAGGTGGWSAETSIGSVVVHGAMNGL